MIYHAIWLRSGGDQDHLVSVFLQTWSEALSREREIRQSDLILFVTRLRESGDYRRLGGFEWTPVDNPMIEQRLQN